LKNYEKLSKNFNNSNIFAHQKHTIMELIENLMKANSPSELETAIKACTDYLEKTTFAKEKAQIKAAIVAKTEAIIKESVETRQKAEQFLSDFQQKEVVIEVNGKKYPLEEWVTIKGYCNRFNLASTSIVTNWMKRGIIPQENILNIKQLNNIKLIKAVPYMG